MLINPSLCQQLFCVGSIVAVQNVDIRKYLFASDLAVFIFCRCEFAAEFADNKINYLIWASSVNIKSFDVSFLITSDAVIRIFAYIHV